MSRQGYDLTRNFLEQAGFLSCYYDNKRGWTITRYWYKTNTDKKELTEFRPSDTNDLHPYGKDRSYKNISFRCNGQGYSISLPRFLWAWFNGSISADKKVKKLDDKYIWPDSFELADWNDHSYYKKSNAVIAMREEVKKFIDAYEHGESYKLKF